MCAESSSQLQRPVKREGVALRARVRPSFDMTDSAKARAPILAAGGIVFREGSRPRIAIVRLRRDKSWVLPKGKLYAGENALAAAFVHYRTVLNVQITSWARLYDRTLPRPAAF